jgi:energy-coupling factor transporter ATP-binding protein EcfA2
MQLVGLDLTDFKAFAKASISLTPTGLALVVGPNNSGKSALLSAVDVIKSPGSTVVIHAGAGAAHLGATFRLDENERVDLLRSLGATQLWLDSDAFHLLRWEFRQEVNFSQVAAVELSASIADGRMAAVVTRPGNLAESRLLSLNLREWVASQPPDRPFDLRLAGQATSWENISTNLDLPGLRDMAGLLNAWRSTAYHFDSQRVGTDRTRPSSSTPDLAPRGENLSEVLLWAHTNAEDEWNAIGRIFKELVPDAGLLTTPTAGLNVSIEFVDEGGNRRNLQDLGTGVEQLLMAVYVGVHNPPSSIIVIEEPETNLHPDAQRGLLRWLREWSKNRQIVLATHSVVFLDGLANEPVWLVERAGGVSSVRAAATAPADILSSLGVRLSDVLTANGLLMVEGKTDRQLIEYWFGTRLQLKHVQVVESNGGDDASRAAAFDRWQKAATTIPQPILFLRDRDELDDKTVARHEKTGCVTVLSRREIENYLLDDGAVASVLQELEDADQEWSSERAAQELRRSADALRSTVVLKRVAERVRSTRLLPREDVARAAAAPDPRAALKQLVVVPTHVVDRVRALVFGLGCLKLQIEEELSWHMLVRS